MKIRTLGWFLGLSMLASPLFASCSQAKIVCAVGHAGSGFGYAVTYAVKGSVPMCAANIDHPTGVKLDKLKGEIIGVETYHPKKDGTTEPNYNITTLAFETEAVGALVVERDGTVTADPNADHKPYAVGTFTTTEPGADNFCIVKDFKPAEQDFPGEDAGGGGAGGGGAGGGGGGAPEPTPPLYVKYEWKDLKFYVTAAAPGTQFTGDVRYTQKDAEGKDCTVEYHAVGLWPATPCAKEVEGADGSKTLAPDPDACLPPNLEEGREFGSGINPDFPTKCDPDLLLCVLTGEPPAFNKSR